MKVFKVIGVFFGVILTLIVVAAIALWLTFDPNDYKGYIAEWVSERTGREFVIDDDLELTFFPWLGVTTGHIRLGNAPGFGDDPFTAIERMTVSVRLLPLLRRQVEISTIRVDGLELNLATDAQGVTNWADLVASRPVAAAGGSTDGQRASLLESLNIAGIDLNNGLIFWRTNTSDVRYVISELSAETGPISPDRPVDAELAFRLVGVDPQLSADVNASGTLVIDSATSSFDTRNLRVAFNLADGRGNERAAGSLQIGNVRVASSGEIEVGRGNLTAMLVAPPIGPERSEVQVDWSSALLSREAETLRVEDLATGVAGMTARWDLSGEALFSSPELHGSVRVADQPLTAIADALELEIDRDARRNLGTVSLDAAFMARPQSRELTLTGLNARALGVGLSGGLSAAADGSVDGRFATDAFDPAQLLALLPQDSIVGIDTAALGRISASAQLRYSPEEQRLELRDIDLAALDTHLTGNLNRSGAEDYEGSIVVASLDSNRLAAVLGDRLPPALPSSALGELALSAQFAYVPGARTLGLSNLAARAAGLDLQGALSLAGIGDTPSWSGRIEVMPFDPERLLARFDHAAPARTDPTTLRRARGSAQIDGDASRATARDLRLVLDDSTITGQLTVGFGEPADYAFDLAIDKLDADRYMPPAAEPPPEGAAPVAADVALPTEPLKTMSLDGRLAIGDLRIAGLSLQTVAAAIDVGDGLGVVDSAKAKLYGGSFAGRIELDTRGEQPRLALDGTAETIQLEPLLADLRGEANMTGSGSFDLDLAGNGAQLSSVLDSSAGRVSFALRDGQLRGFNLGRALCSAYNATQSLPRPASTGAEVTAFQVLRGSAEVSEGIARTDDLEATMAFMSVTGRGQSDLLSRDINYDLVATLTGGVGINGCESMDPLIGDSVPVRVTGTILAPEIAPDYSAIVRGRIRNELQDRLRERLEQLGR